MWVWFGGPVGRSAKQAGRAKISSLLACKNLACIAVHADWATVCAGWLASPHKKKNLHLCISVTFLIDLYMNVPNSCMSEKDKYYIFLNVLKFEYYILYVKV